MNISVGKWQIRVYLDKQVEHTGVCSTKADNPKEHMLLWDFDDAKLGDIVNQLLAVSCLYSLPKIYLVSSSPGNYHAYCFASRDFRETISILASTKSIDLAYLRMGVARGYFTLRITPRKGGQFRLIRIIRSQVPNEMRKSVV